MFRRCCLFPLVVISALAPALRAQGLDQLTRVQPGRSARVSSSAADPRSNRDNLWMKPGETRVLADLPGPATITHIWLTFSEPAPNWLSAAGSANPSEMVLRMYWDDAEQPAVETPLGDFFAAGFGRRAEVRSTPVQVEGGDSYNCYWPMPFFKHGKITLTNEGDKNISAFYYQIDYVREERLPPDTAYFCAQYRQEFPEQPGHDYVILDAVGHGHLVGVVLSARSRSPMWFGEGDDRIYVDGEENPSLVGTGTEDFLLSAWGLEKCSFPNFGVTMIDGGIEDPGMRVCGYRWYLSDPVRFTKSLRVELEHAGWMSADETASGKVEGFVEREDDLATVAFWYQQGQPKRFTTLPSAKDRVPPNLDLIIDGKALLPTARHSGGEIRLQPGYDWTGEGQVFFVPANDPADAPKPPATQPNVAASAEKIWLEVDFNIAKQEYRRFILRLTHSYDYGKFQVLLDGKEIGGPLDLYTPQIEVQDHQLGDYELAPGKHTIRLQCVGRNPASAGHRLGVDSVRLRERWLKKRPRLEP